MTESFPLSHRQHGFTLVEAVAVIVITGILAAVVAVFIAGPVGGYVDVTRRIILSDMADNALRRIGRDIHLAVPNSVRVSNDRTQLEFIPTRDGARYRYEKSNISGVESGSVLDFSTDVSATKASGTPQYFDIFTISGVDVASNDFMVVFNTNQPGAADCKGGGADAYQGCNRRGIAEASGMGISYTNTNLPLPFDSPGHRVNFVPASGPVTYACRAGELRRYTSYGWNHVVPDLGGALLVENVSACAFAYSPGTTQRNGLVTLSLTLTRNGESITLYHEIHVDNQP